MWPPTPTPVFPAIFLLRFRRKAVKDFFLQDFMVDSAGPLGELAQTIFVCQHRIFSFQFCVTCSISFGCLGLVTENCDQHGEELPRWPFKEGLAGSAVSRLPPAVGSFGVCSADKTTLLEILPFWSHLTSVTRWGEGIKIWQFWLKVGRLTSKFLSRAPSGGPQTCGACVAIRLFFLPNPASAPFFSEVLNPNKHLTPKLPFKICFWSTSPGAAAFSI